MDDIKLSFDRAFQVEIIKLLYQRFEFLAMCADVLKPEYFDDSALGRYFQLIVEYYRKYSSKMTLVAIRNEIEKERETRRLKDEQFIKYIELFEVIDKPVLEEEYIKNEVTRFCKMQETKKAILECSKLVISQDGQVWDEIFSKIGKAVRVGDNQNSQGTHYFRDKDVRIELREKGDDRLVIPTGIKDLDQALKGGPRAGQIAFWMAPSGHGKSVALAHVGKRAVISGYKVLHYTLELSELETADRYDACWAKVPFQQLAHSSEKISKELNNLHTKYGDSLIIKEYPTRGASVNTIEAHMVNLINSGWVPNLIIVDYLDLLHPTTNYKDQYADLGAITGDLRGLGAKYNCVVWTATQTNRSGYNMEIIDMEQASDSMQKMMIADIVIPICMNKDERLNNKARLFIAKNRNGPAKVEIPISTAYERMCFYDPVSTANMHDIAEATKENKPVKLNGAPGLPIPKTATTNRRQPINKLKTTKFPMDDDNDGGDN